MLIIDDLYAPSLSSVRRRLFGCRSTSTRDAESSGVGVVGGAAASFGSGVSIVKSVSYPMRG